MPRTSVIVFLLLGAGVVLRLLNYAAGESLWLDESYVAVDVIGRTWPEIFSGHSLFPDQPVAPPLFLVIVKLLTVLLGSGEYVLRLFPFAAGAASLFLYAVWAKRFLKDHALEAAAALLAFSSAMIYYAAELKPYAGDVLTATALLLMMDQVWQKQRNGWWLAAAGGAGLWLSYANIFLLAAWWPVWAVRTLRDRRWQDIPALLGAVGIWGASFLTMYTFFLGAMTGNAYLWETWRPWLPPLGAGAMETGLWWGRQLVAWGGYPFGWSGAGIALWGLGGLGAWSLGRRDRGRLALLTAPLMLVLTAVALRRYPLQGRVLLFLYPLMFALMAEGLGWLMTRWTRRGAVIAGGVLLLILIPGMMLEGPPPKAENRTAMAYLSRFYQKGDGLLLNVSAQFPFWYYAFVQGLSPRLPGVIDGTWEGDPQGKVVFRLNDHPRRNSGGWYTFQQGTIHDYDRRGAFRRMLFGRERFALAPGQPMPYHGRVWVFFSHIPERDREANRRLLDAHGCVLQSWEGQGAAVYLYVFGEASRPLSSSEGPAVFF